jgi:hypothetical protein
MTDDSVARAAERFEQGASLAVVAKALLRWLGPLRGEPSPVPFRIRSCGRVR